MSTFREEAVTDDDIDGDMGHGRKKPQKKFLTLVAVVFIFEGGRSGNCTFVDILQLPIEVQTFCSKKTPELVAASLLPVLWSKPFYGN